MRGGTLPTWRGERPISGKDHVESQHVVLILTHARLAALCLLVAAMHATGMHTFRIPPVDLFAPLVGTAARVPQAAGPRGILPCLCDAYWQSAATSAALARAARDDFMRI